MVPFRHLPALILLAALPACVDSGASCAREEMRELRTVDKLIEDTQAAIARGYRTERDQTGGSFNFCLGGGGSHVGAALCTDPSTRTRPVAIDIAAEERKLKALEARRMALRSTINARTARCTAGGA